MESNKFEVSVSAGEDKIGIYYIITCRMNICNTTIKVIFNDDDMYSLESWKKILNCIKNSEDLYISGGGNSGSSVSFDNGILNLEADVNGSGGNVKYSIMLNVEDAIMFVSKIITEFEATIASF